MERVRAPQPSFESKSVSVPPQLRRLAKAQAAFCQGLEDTGHPGLGQRLLACVDRQGHLDLSGDPPLLHAVSEAFGKDAWSVLNHAVSLGGAEGITKITVPDISLELASGLIETGLPQMPDIGELAFFNPGTELREKFFKDSEGGAKAWNAHGATVALTSLADPRTLEVEPVASVLGGYMGVQPGEDPKHLWKRMEGRIAQPSLRLLNESYGKYHAIVSDETGRRPKGGRCFLGDERGILQGTLLFGTEDALYIHLPPHPANPVDLGLDPDQMTPGELADSIYSFPIHTNPGAARLWVPREEDPALPTHETTSTLASLSSCPAPKMYEGCRVFDFSGFPEVRPLIMVKGLDNKFAKFRHDGSTQVFGQKLHGLFVPKNPADSRIENANPYDEIWMAGKRVFHMPGTPGDKLSNDEMLVCSLEESPELRSLCRNDPDCRSINDGDLAGLKQKREPGTTGAPAHVDPYALLIGKNAWFYRVRKPGDTS